jgi:flagellar biogenesis protein FliO
MELTEQIAMVLAVFALMGGLLWVLRRRGMVSLPAVKRRKANSRLLEVLERVPLTPQHAIHLVRVSGKVVLIGTAPSACILLDRPAVETFSSTLSQDLIGSNQ